MVLILSHRAHAAVSGPSALHASRPNIDWPRGELWIGTVLVTVEGSLRLALKVKVLRHDKPILRIKKLEKSSTELPTKVVDTGLLKRPKQRL